MCCIATLFMQVPLYAESTDQAITDSEQCLILWHVPPFTVTSTTEWQSALQVSLYADYTDEPLGIPNLELNFVAGEPADAPRASMNTAVPQGRFASEWFPLPAVGYEPTRKGEALLSMTCSSSHNT